MRTLRFAVLLQTLARRNVHEPFLQVLEQARPQFRHSGRCAVGYAQAGPLVRP